MRIALIGYGKMGQLIEKIALDRGNTISKTIDISNPQDMLSITPENTDVAIEFTAPEVAFDNIMTILKQGVPVVSGSTGWLDRKQEVDRYCLENDGTFFYASNYSLGVNIFFKLNKYLAELMSGRTYKASIEDIHHIHKLDSPSGTAITIAEGIIEKDNELKDWREGDTDNDSTLSIYSKREGEVPGTHSVHYTSEIDDIKITHEAHSRKGFALGAVMVGEWIKGKKGVLGMDDYLDLKA